MDREVVKISSLKAAPYNPRQISGEALAGLSKSLERWGVVQEVVANKRTGYIVGGHQRVAALKKMGVKEVPVVWVDLDDVEEKALNVALNNPHISGEFDDTIAGLLTEIRDGIGPDDFESLMLDDLLPQGEEVTPLDDMPDLPDGDKEPFQQMTFTLHDEQAEQIKAALQIAKDMGAFEGPNENSNGNALARVCETFLTMRA